MTTIENKNIAIAKMLDWSFEHPTKDFKCGTFFINPPNYVLNIGHSVAAEDLKFHLDANWQFEAIDWIEKQNIYIKIEKPIGKLSSWFVNFDSEHSEIKEVQVFNKNRTKAIFEALYQFSQYVKNK